MTALAWISDYRHWKQFVRNRVNEIRKLACVENWRHFPRELNSADLPTRGGGGGGLLERTWLITNYGSTVQNFYEAIMINM